MNLLNKDKMKILLASNNRHKHGEIQQIIDLYSPNLIVLLLPEDILSQKIEVEETGNTLEENAYLKARALFDLTNLPSIADDTGLEVDALNGAPGVHSARFAGEDCIDSDNRKKLLSLLKDVPAEKRTSKFRTVICFINNERIEYIEGMLEGRIITEERGSMGFGYDSLFIPDGYYKTFAEMTPEEKNSISHRGNAIRNFVDFMSRHSTVVI